MAERLLPSRLFSHLKEGFPISTYERTSDECGKVMVGVSPIPMADPACRPRDGVLVGVRPIPPKGPEWYPPWAQRKVAASGRMRKTWEGHLCGPKGMDLNTRAGREKAADLALAAYETHRCGLRLQGGPMLQGLRRRRR